jgi:hypothetical protein
MKTLTTQRFDRLIDLLLDRKHPFWKDERQTAVYTEGATAAFIFQSLLVPVVGGIGLLIGGKQVLGIITAMVLTVGMGGWLVFGVLARRHVDIDVKQWTKDSSRTRRAVSIVISLFYAACVLWVLYRDSLKTGDRSTVLGSLVGAGTAIAGFVVAAKVLRRMKKRGE